MFQTHPHMSFLNILEARKDPLQLPLLWHLRQHLLWHLRQHLERIYVIILVVFL